MKISHFIHGTRVLGPRIRSALWTSGCCFDCEGCLAKEMNARPPIEVDAGVIAGEFASAEECEGITISGGEPFLQSEALSEMILKIRRIRDYGVIVYTGFTMEELRLKGNDGINGFLGLIDILIDGKYEMGLDDGKPFRGSSNQRVICLTDRYEKECEKYYAGRKGRVVEFRLEADASYMIGVPSRSAFQAWKLIEAKGEGHGI